MNRSKSGTRYSMGNVLDLRHRSCSLIRENELLLSSSQLPDFNSGDTSLSQLFLHYLPSWGRIEDRAAMAQRIVIPKDEPGNVTTRVEKNDVDVEANIVRWKHKFTIHASSEDRAGIRRR